MNPVEIIGWVRDQLFNGGGQLGPLLDLSAVGRPSEFEVITPDGARATITVEVMK